MSRKLSIRELATLPSFYFPTVSWRGDKIAFFEDKTDRIELYVLDIGVGATSQISRGRLPKTVRMGPVLSRDDRLIFVIVDRDGDEQFDIFAFDLEKGTFFPVSESQ